MKYLLILFFLITSYSFSQVTSFVGVGFGFPQTTYGVWGGVMMENNYGFYLSVLGNFKKPLEENLYTNINYNAAKYTYQDREKSKFEDRKVIDLGIIYSVHKYLNFYAALGWQTKVEYAEFFDSTFILGDNGNYFVEKVNKQGIGLSGGLLFPIGEKLKTQIGGTIGIVNGMTAGVSYVF